MTAWLQPSLRAILPVCQLSEIPIKCMAKQSARTGTTLPGLASPCLCVSLTQIASSAFIILFSKIHYCKPPRNDGIHPSPDTGSLPAAHCLPITACSPIPRQPGPHLTKNDEVMCHICICILIHYNNMSVLKYHN